MKHQVIQTGSLHWNTTKVVSSCLYIHMYFCTWITPQPYIFILYVGSLLQHVGNQQPARNPLDWVLEMITDRHTGGFNAMMQTDTVMREYKRFYFTVFAHQHKKRWINVKCKIHIHTETAVPHHRQTVSHLQRLCPVTAQISDSNW